MAAIKKSVRLVDHTIKVCHELTLQGDTNYSGAINAMAEQLSIFVEENAPALSEMEWNAFYSCYNGYMPHSDQREEAKLLAWHISEGYQYDESIRQFIGTEEQAVALIERVKSWSTAERLAVIYKSKAFWRKSPISNEED